MRVKDLAYAAFDAAYDKDMDTARAHVQRIARRGSGALNEAMLRWVDRAIDRLGIPRHGTVEFAMEQDGTAEELSADQVRPEVLWAGRMFAARVANDRQTWIALMLAVPHDPDVITDHIMALLDTTTTTVAAADEDTQARPCCAFHAQDPDVQAARLAVAHLN